MHLTALVHSVENETFFTVIKDGRKVYFYLQKNLVKKMPESAEFGGIAMASASGNSVICDKDGNAIVDGYSWLNKPMSEEIAEVFGKDFGPEVRESSGWGLAPSFPSLSRI